MSETAKRNGFLSSRFSRRQAIQGAGALGLAAAMAPVIGPRAMAAPLAQDATPKAGGTLTVGLQADPTALDPQKQSLTAIWRVVEHFYQGLTGIGADLAPYPLLAETIEISEDGLTLTFKLREGVTYHDGAVMTSDDVLFSYHRLLDPAIASTNASNLLGVVGAPEFNSGAATEISGLTAVDDLTVQLVLTAPDASLMVVLASPASAVFNRAFTEANGNDLSQVVNGTGPFKLVEYIPNTSVSVEKHTEYWEEACRTSMAWKCSSFRPTSRAPRRSFRARPDLIEYAPLADIQTFLDDSDNFTVAGDSNTNIRYMSFNFDVEPFGDLRVRQAIAKAVDRGPIVDSAVFGYGTAVGTLFPPDFWAVLPTEVAGSGH